MLVNLSLLCCIAHNYVSTVFHWLQKEWQHQEVIFLFWLCNFLSKWNFCFLAKPSVKLVSFDVSIFWIPCALKTYWLIRHWKSYLSVTYKLVDYHLDSLIFVGIKNWEQTIAVHIPFRLLLSDSCLSIGSKNATSLCQKQISPFFNFLIRFLLLNWKNLCVILTY